MVMTHSHDAVAEDMAVANVIPRGDKLVELRLVGRFATAIVTLPAHVAGGYKPGQHVALRLRVKP